MKFSTLTKKDIVEAYENRIPIDRHQVDSGVARHILDFYFGVNISKALMKSVSAAKKKKIFKVICRKSSNSDFVYFG